MKVNEVLVMLKADGWHLATTRGSHRQFKYLVKSGRVTVPSRGKFMFTLIESKEEIAKVQRKLESAIRPAVQPSMHLYLPMEPTGIGQQTTTARMSQTQGN